jgi:hypothetical protein
MSTAGRGIFIDDTFQRLPFIPNHQTESFVLRVLVTLHIQGADNNAYFIYNMSGCLMLQDKANNQTAIGENLQEGIFLLKIVLAK